MDILWFLVIGLIVGVIGRFLVPGNDPLGVLGTMLLGVVGSFVGGFLVSLVSSGEARLTPAGWIGSIVGAVLALLVYRSVKGRRLVT